MDVILNYFLGLILDWLLRFVLRVKSYPGEKNA